MLGCGVANREWLERHQEDPLSAQQFSSMKVQLTAQPNKTPTEISFDRERFLKEDSKRGLYDEHGYS